MRVVYTPRAARSVEKADAWWREHREETELLTEEFIEATKLLEHAPHIGRRVVNAGLADVRIRDQLTM